MSWHYRGGLTYLLRQAQRFGVSIDFAHMAKSNKEIHRASGLLAQLCERYHTSRSNGRAHVVQGDGPPDPIFGGSELAQIKGTLGQAEVEDTKLHLLAAASRQQLDEAWRAFRCEPPHRSFAVVGEYDEITAPFLGAGAAVEALPIAPAGFNLCQSPASGACPNGLNPSRPYATATVTVQD